MKRHILYLAALPMADYDEMSCWEVTATCWRSIKAAEEEKAAEFQRVLFYRSYPLSGVVLREPADVHHSHHVQQVSLVRRTGKNVSERKIYIFFLFFFVARWHDKSLSRLQGESIFPEKGKYGRKIDASPSLGSSSVCCSGRRRWAHLSACSGSLGPESKIN